MTTPTEHLEKFSREDLIRTVQTLEDSLAEAAKGLMTEGSAQEFAALKVLYAEQGESLKLARQELEWRRNQMRGLSRDVQRFAGYLDRIPRLIRWWYGC